MCLACFHYIYKGKYREYMDKRKNYYTSGAFAKKANVTIRTVRYYDKQGLLKPSHRSEAGYRLYTDEDFVKLQKILALKYLGFSLEEIGAMTLYDTTDTMKQSLELQIRLIEKKREHLEMVENALLHTKKIMDKTSEVDWSQMLKLIHLTNMERDLVEQYKNSSNLNIRIELHERYSKNPQGWFPWLYSQIDFQDSSRILEIGCGNGELWKSAHVEKDDEAARKGSTVELPAIWSTKQICLTDISEGMVEAAKEALEALYPNTFSYEIFEAGAGMVDLKEFVAAHFDKNSEYKGLDVQKLDIIIANHVLFYVKNLDETLEEFSKVLRKGGTLYASTYGTNHMREITELVQEFDTRIKLSEVALYEQFGLENGEQMLAKHFSEVELRMYEDELVVDDAKALADYILSCHGNQKEMLANRYEEFTTFLEDKIKKLGAIHITKEAGVWIARV